MENLEKEEKLDQKIEEIQKEKEEKEREKMEQEKQERKKKMIEERKQILKELRDDLFLGESKSVTCRVRGQEVLGIYGGNNEFIGNIFSDSSLFEMSKKEFQDKVCELLAHESEKNQFEINIDNPTKEVMTKTGIILKDKVLILKNHEKGLEINLYSNGENKSIDIEKIDDKRILLRVNERKGKIIEYIIDNGVFLPDSRVIK